MKKSAICVAVLVALAGCGGDSDDDGQAAVDEMFGDVPECSEVWQVGETLDLATYEGCQEGDNISAAVTSGCYDDENNYLGQVASYEDRLWVLQTDTDPKTGEGGTPGEITDVDPTC